MKAKPMRFVYGDGYHPCEPKEATHVQLHMVGPFHYRMIPVMIGGTRAGTGNWTWNGDVEKPTLKPSILTKGGHPDRQQVCHCFVNDGMVQFLDDCTHEFAGTTVELLEVED